MLDFEGLKNSLERLPDDDLRARFSEILTEHPDGITDDRIAAELDAIQQILHVRRLSMNTAGASFGDAEYLAEKLKAQRVLDPSGAKQTARTLQGILNGLHDAFDDLREANKPGPSPF